MLSIEDSEPEMRHCSCPKVAYLDYSYVASLKQYHHLFCFLTICYFISFHAFFRKYGMSIILSNGFNILLYRAEERIILISAEPKVSNGSKIVFKSVANCWGLNVAHLKKKMQRFIHVWAYK